MCVLCGSVLMFSVFGALALMNHTMSSADEKKNEFSLKQTQEEEQVSDADVVVGEVMTEKSKKKADRIVCFACEYQGLPYVQGGTKLPDLSKIDRDDYSLTYNKEKGNTVVLRAGSRWGDEAGVDSSGFVMKVFEEFGIELPRTVEEQTRVGREVKIKDIQPGDIVFYGAGEDSITHCGIYVKDGRVLHASAQAGMVIDSDMNYRRIAAVRRVCE